VGRPVTDRAAMVAQMSPSLDDEIWRFVAVSPGTAPQLLGAAIATFREEEGVSAIVPAALADELGESGPDFQCITLRINSDLEGVGLTASVASALADAGIACNMVAALHHDHCFVPAPRANDALELLEDLSSAARGDD